MPLISQEEIAHFEKAIYLPMVLIILERDRMLFEKGSFKLKRPYIELVDGAIKQVHKELQETKIHMRKHHMKMIKGTGDDTFTEYVFYHGGYEDHRRYLNVRLRNRVEELLRVYLAMSYQEI
ncbi:hypothetical protein QWY16_05950 [Planococcus shenhongbingii]|uniref:hypothetical protein n=1 Tax=Planococcus shenhongbingii TaxID=3058398 RepID=UPI00260BA446|nr:hypothetical protein [Planococcus sp. N016]WKA59669.1 hypothetical protein QWY16_05950 [Planococcus sp. N016]